MKMLTTVGVALALVLVTLGSASAADIPDFLAGMLQNTAEQIAESEAIGPARVVGDVERRTITLAAAPIELNGIPLKTDLAVLGATFHASLDYVYDPMILVGESDFYGGIGGRLVKGDGFAAAGVGLVSQRIDEDHTAWWIAGGWNFSFR